MCRNIKTLFNFEPPATKAEIRDASLQFVRKLSGFTHPSKANQVAFERAVEEIAASAEVLIGSLVTNAQARTREEEAAKARERSALRFRRVSPLLALRASVDETVASGWRDPTTWPHRTTCCEAATADRRGSDRGSPWPGRRWDRCRTSRPRARPRPRTR